MPNADLRGVIAAAATPITEDFEPDRARFIALCRKLLAQGCDGLNICGTTGEATSFTAAQRMAIMSAAAAALPLTRLMVGTGAAALADTIALTKHAADLGFAGALIIPPFYYKDITDDGMLQFFARIVAVTAEKPIGLYLYNFPALSGVPYTPASKIRPAISATRAASSRRSPICASSRATRRFFCKRAPAIFPAASRRAPTSIPNSARALSTTATRRR
jgi:dihydrodipicolinate synthase/N-acetylneuraminate lyase